MMIKLSAAALSAIFFLGAAPLTWGDTSSIAKNLSDASPSIHWPEGYAPAVADVFVHNEIVIDAPARMVWQNLVTAVDWPTWYSNSAEVKIDGDVKTLGSGSAFTWRTFGFPVKSKVDTFTPSRELGWFGSGGAEFRAYHAWLIVDKGTACQVITEETQLGRDAIQFNCTQPTAISDAHHWWLTALKARSERQWQSEAKK